MNTCVIMPLYSLFVETPYGNVTVIPIYEECNLTAILYPNEPIDPSIMKYFIYVASGTGYIYWVNTGRHLWPPLSSPTSVIFQPHEVCTDWYYIISVHAKNKYGYNRIGHVLFVRGENTTIIVGEDFKELTLLNLNDYGAHNCWDLN